jgi:hypothetical protein
MLNTKLLTQVKKTFVLFTGALNYASNEDNQIRIKDFNIITTKKSMDIWQLDLYGPDNIPFIIQHPKLGFYSNTWHVKKGTSIAPWFLSELPDKLFLIAMQWWMRFIGYRTWISTAEKSMYYMNVFNKGT